MDDPTVELLLSFAQFDNPRTPKSKKMQVNYDQIIGGDLPQEVRNMLKLGTQQRRLLVQGLSYAGAVPNPRNVIEAVNSYLPSVWKIQKSLEFSKDTKIKLMAPLHFEWSTGLAKSTPVKPIAQAHGIFVFEMNFILMARAVSHYNLARQHIETVRNKFNLDPNTFDPEEASVNEAFKEAIKELRIGAGVIDFTAAEVLAKWRKVPADPLPENRAGVLKALSMFFLCQAQRIFIAKAILTKKYSVLPNLLLGLSNKAEAAHRIALSEEMDISAKLGQVMSPSIAEEMGIFTSLAEALAFKYSGEIYYEKVANGNTGTESIENAFGKAVGFMRQAMNKIGAGANAILSKPRYQTPFRSEITAIQALLKKYEEENSTVYFGIVNTDDCDLPPRSQHKFVIRADAFTMPEVGDALSFEQITRAPPGVTQADFDAMPKDIQKELLAEHQQKLVADAKREAEEAKKNKGGMFGFGGKKNKKKKDAEPAATENAPPSTAAASTGLEAPPGVDETVFNALPRDMQLEIIKERMGNAAANASAALADAALMAQLQTGAPAKSTKSGKKPVW